MSRTDLAFERFVKKIELFIATSKTFMQLGSGALALSILFVEKVLSDSFQSLSFWLILFWLAMGVTVISSAMYQYLAVKLLEHRFQIGWVINNTISRVLVENPGIMFGTMLISFIFGVCFFVVFAIKSLTA